MNLHHVANVETSLSGRGRASPQRSVDSRDGGRLDHALQGDLTDAPLQPVGLDLTTRRSASGIAVGRSAGDACSTAAGRPAGFVDLQRRQHGGLPAEDDVVRRDAADVSQRVPGEDRVGEEGVEDDDDAPPLHLLLGGVHGVPEDGTPPLDETSALPRGSYIDLDTPTLHLCREEF